MSRLSVAIGSALWAAATMVLAQAERAPATQSEIDEVWNSSGFDSEDRDDVALEVWREYSDADAYALVAVFRFRPIHAQSAVCIAQHYVWESERQEQGLFWYPPTSTYYHWLGQSARDCDVGFDPPTDAVRIYDAVPTGTVIEILQGGDRLLQRTLEHADGAEFRDRETAWRLRDISVNQVLDPELGIAYGASFVSQAGGPPNGPSVVFTISDGQFIVQRVGIWAY